MGAFFFWECRYGFSAPRRFEVTHEDAFAYPVGGPSTPRGYSELVPRNRRRTSVSARNNGLRAAFKGIETGGCGDFPRADLFRDAANGTNGMQSSATENAFADREDGPRSGRPARGSFLSWAENALGGVGFKGPDCEKATLFLEEVLGVVGQKRKKPEYHRQARKSNQQRLGG